MRLLAEASDTAKGFPPLSLLHPSPRALFDAGAKPASMSGGGEDFFQYRPYNFGDNAQNIDWRQSARSNDILIREQERLLPHRVYLFCDNSSAMQFNSRSALPTKSYAAQRLLLSLSNLLIQGGSHISPLGAPLKAYNLPALARELSKESNETIPAQINLKQRSHLIVASDFRQGVSAWRPIIKYFACHHIVGTCIQMLDPIEYEFPLYGRVRLESAEDDKNLVIASADSVRPFYLRRLAAEQTAIKKLCLQYGWQWVSLATTMNPRAQLSDLLQVMVNHQ